MSVTAVQSEYNWTKRLPLHPDARKLSLRKACPSHDHCSMALWPGDSDHKSLPVAVIRDKPLRIRIGVFRTKRAELG